MTTATPTDASATLAKSSCKNIPRHTATATHVTNIVTWTLLMIIKLCSNMMNSSLVTKLEAGTLLDGEAANAATAARKSCMWRARTLKSDSGACSRRTRVTFGNFSTISPTGRAVLANIVATHAVDELVTTAGRPA